MNAARVMPHRMFTLEEVAKYLHLDPQDIERLVKNRDIPFERHGPRVVFRRVDIDAWASPRVMGMDGGGLADYHRKSSAAASEHLPHETLIPQLLSPKGIDPMLRAKTRPAVLRAMTELAKKTGLVCDSAGLLSGLEAREAICSTGMPGGLALLHTRHPEPWLFEAPFIVLGRAAQLVPFGAPDGRPTDLFFLLATPDDRFHLHTLARVALLAQKTDVLEQLRAADDADEMFDLLVASEAQILSPGGA